MPLFPMFVDLSRSAALVVGEGPEAERKAEKLRPFCAEVLRCPYPPVYDTPPALVVLAEKNHPENAHWASHFRSLGIPVNTADRPELCDFQFPALIARGDVSIGIATGGKSPVLAGLLRRRVEAALPEELDELCLRAAELTAELRQAVPDQRERARILQTEFEKLL